MILNTLAVSLADASYVVFAERLSGWFWPRGVLTVLTGVGVCYWMVTSWLVWRRYRVLKRGERALVASREYGRQRLQPITFFRPVKRGVPGLEVKATSLVKSARAGDEVLFGVDAPEDFAVCLAACAKAPNGVHAQVLFCQPGQALNPKVSKLLQLAPHAACDAWVVTDSEMLLVPGEMDALREEWAESGAAAFTAGYRFVGAERLPERLDHLSALLNLWPGLAFKRFGAEHDGQNQGLGFTLGACMGCQREDLETLGGWEALGEYLAEDFHLGAKLGALGRQTHFSAQVLTLDSDRMSWPGWFHHQMRVWRTYRACDSAGTAGMVLTHGLFWSGLLVVLTPSSLFGWAVFLAAAGVRLMTARILGNSLNFPVRAASVFVASACETLFYLLSWVPGKVEWGGRLFRLKKNGKLELGS